MGVLPWFPTDSADIEVQKAFEDLKASLLKGIVQTKEGVPNRFILHSKGYFGGFKCIFYMI